MKQPFLLFFLLAIPAALCAQSITGTWSTASSTGFKARSDFAVAAVNGKIYVIGGKMGSALISEVDVYDPTTDTWSTPTTTGTFTPRWSLGCAVVNGLIYTISGTLNNTTMLTTLEVFDPSTNTWSTPTTQGTLIGRDAFATAVVNGKIYVMGGYIGGSDINTTQVFDPMTNTWSTLSTTGTFTARDGLTACSVGNKIYTMAGISDDFSNTLEVLDVTTNTWSTPATTGTFTSRSSGASDVIDGKIYVVGGENDSSSWIPGLQVFDPATNLWSTAVTTDSVIPRRELGAVTLNGKFYAMGGFKKDSIFSEYSNDIQYFTPATSGVSIPSSLEPLTFCPNPTNGMVTINGIAQEGVDISISNTLGVCLVPRQPLEGWNGMLDLSTFIAGPYFITVYEHNQRFTQIIVKR